MVGVRWKGRDTAECTVVVREGPSSPVSGFIGRETFGGPSFLVVLVTFATVAL